METYKLYSMNYCYAILIALVVILFLCFIVMEKKSMFTTKRMSNHLKEDCDCDEMDKDNVHRYLNSLVESGEIYNEEPEDTGEYVERLSETVLDDTNRALHYKWAYETKPWAQTAKTIDDLGEQIWVSNVGQGITAFRPLPAPQKNPLFITEIGPEDHLKYGSRTVI